MLVSLLDVNLPLPKYAISVFVVLSIGRCTGPPISAASSLAPGSDLKVDNTCSVGEESPTSDDSLAGHISSEREVALDESALKKARVDESSIFLFSLILFPLKKTLKAIFVVLLTNKAPFQFTLYIFLIFN